jgi:hypothetical protein
MPQDKIIFSRSSRPGALALTGQPGSLEAVLNQVLVAGFNERTISITLADGVATAAAAGHGFVPYDVVMVSGATDDAYNGYKTVVGATANTFTFAAPGAVQTPAEGTITAKFAPLGWSRTWTNGLESAFKGDDHSAPTSYLYVDHSGTRGSRSYRMAWVRGFEQWSADIGLEPWPTVEQRQYGQVWQVSSTVDATARAYWIAGNGRFFYVAVAWHASYSTLPALYWFGDCLSGTPGDEFPGVLLGGSSEAPSYPDDTGIGSIDTLTQTNSHLWKARNYHQGGAAINLGLVGNSAVSGTLGRGGMPHPNPADNGTHISALELTDGAQLVARLPGAYHILHDQPYTSDYVLLPPLPEFPGRRFLCCHITVSSYSAGRIVLDITGPWE